MNARTIINADFLDILFDGRNKDYGAYELRRSENRRVRNAIVGTASIALVVIGGYVVSNKLMAADMHTRKEIIVPPTVIKILEIPEEAPVTPPPPAVHTPPPASSTIGFVTPKITDQEIAENETEVPPMDSIGNKAIGLANTIGDDINGVDNPFESGDNHNGVVEPPAAKAPVDHPPYVWVELMPSFPGGDAALSKFLQKNMRYPRMAQETGIEGKIFVQFVVNKQGKISDVQTVGAHKGGGLEEEAMRVVKMMPDWKPGKQNGEYVNVRFNLPIGFQLEH
ncbi:energy transducer TonB [Chitinophaga rhizophila]|uniref:Energy transducer TonB n=1 Tax=Chitinophaga rhizophila TaxID=2866212 RepID=A0ABS7GCB4_9BACT|nr:energy transducer TonB [Chitinophaga rhizophila]MBW8684434.1 energy transducer TonB [Chitinophaga rhizophila]